MIDQMKTAANDLAATINATAGQLDQIGQQDLQAALDNLTRASADLQDRFARAAGEMFATLSTTLIGIQQTMAGLAAALAVPAVVTPATVPEVDPQPVVPASGEHRRQVEEIAEVVTVENHEIEAEYRERMHNEAMKQEEVAAVAANSPVEDVPAQATKKPRKHRKSA